MAYERIHPAVLVLYFLSVTIPAMFSLNPLLLIPAFAGAVFFLLLTEPEPPKFRTVLWLALLTVLIIVINPLFSHRGQTELFFINGHAITLEALLYGVRNAFCVLTVLLWCRIFNRTVSSEKLLALLGKTFPKTALLLSSSLRLVPLLRSRAASMRDTQQELGLYGNGEMSDRLTGGARVFSMLVTWSLDHASDMSSSMKARGYGLKGRTTYSVYRFKKRDAVLTMLLILLVAGVLTVMATGGLAFSFYPVLSAKHGAATTTALICYAVTALAAAAFEAFEAIRWKVRRSRI
ncbi:MAG: hypothetical protein J6P36_08225 [Lachnospiraceae bacterium]|nr:hypothetical protein [Lachnospiraceae bacterium]